MNEERMNVCFENRFVMCSYDAIMSGELKAHEIAVYVVLCAFASNTNRSCYPSYATLAEKAGCSRSTVIRTIAVLEERGLIKKINQVDEEGNRMSNLYVIKTAAKRNKDNHAASSAQTEVVSEENHPSVSEIPVEPAKEDEISMRHQQERAAVSEVVSEGHGGSVCESHELNSFNYKIKPEEDDEEQLKQKIEYAYFSEEMPDRIGFIDTLLGVMMTLKHDGRPEQLKLLDKVDSCVILEFMDEFKDKPINHVRNYTAWLKAVFMQYLQKREAYQKDFW